MAPISPEEDDLFVRGLRFLFERRIAMENCEGDLTPVRREPDSPEEPPA